MLSQIILVGYVNSRPVNVHPFKLFHTVDPFQRINYFGSKKYAYQAGPLASLLTLSSKCASQGFKVVTTTVFAEYIR